MHIAVLGGGIVGVTTAYELMKQGHQVTVIEKNPAVAIETSWGNAGMIAPGHSFAWSSPHAPFILLKSLVLRNQSLRFKPSLDPRLWTWSLQFLAQCTHKRSEFNTIRKHKLASYSQSIFHETLADIDLKFDRVSRGILYFYRNQSRLDAGIDHMKIMGRLGQQIEVYDRRQVLALEPSLQAVGHKIAGGIYCPTDETGDCNKFGTALAAYLASNGVEIRTDEEVLELETSGDEITGVRTSKGQVKADLYVMCLANGASRIARKIGVSLPIYPVKGYSLTIPVGNKKAPPTIGSVDEENLVAISPFGDRVRVTATAEFAGYNTSYKPSDFKFMAGIVRELYPDGAEHDKAQMWAGLRPMTPTNLPIIGKKKHRNLFYNTGHGHIGWTMSHGSARLSADVIGGRKPAFPIEEVVD
ncbi:amino acid dehydrogenase [Brucella anthropi]|uniref:D-amino acid dehydrogenase n=1 Tax=Brucella anthropi TaxID=529 RepID=UPI0004516D68|nr:D-amino acid dehydrogenase [Brucella anthropi]EXL06516.1 amino acid dehydrogenase [Brucella anthropi]